MEATGKCIIISAPSGAGKTTIVQYLLGYNLGLEFSISATSREKRDYEKEALDYYFVGVEGFKSFIEEDKFVEWEEVYPDQFYGTLKSEIERIWEQGKTVIFDVDVVGGLNLKKFFGDNALAIFIQPPSINALRQRLEKRASETQEKIDMRIKKASKELEQADGFDVVILNERLEVAVIEALKVVKAFLNQG